MQTETDDLIGAALDYAVAVAEGHTKPGAVILHGGRVWLSEPTYRHDVREWHPSTDWAQGGPIIERECIDLKFFGNYVRALTMSDDGEVVETYGPTPLVAAMRCHVAAKLGDTVEIPATLNQTEKA